MIQSNSKIFTNRIFGNSTNESATALANTNLVTQETYLGSSGASNMGTIVPRVPSNQKVAKDR
jgi:hypothetical protein